MHITKLSWKPVHPHLIMYLMFWAFGVIICSFWVTCVLLLGCSLISAREVALFWQIDHTPVKRVKYGGQHWAQSTGLVWELQPGEEVLLLLTLKGQTTSLNSMLSFNLRDQSVPPLQYQNTNQCSAPLSFTPRLRMGSPPRVLCQYCRCPLSFHLLSPAALVTPVSSLHQRLSVRTCHCLCQVDADTLTSVVF